MTLYNKILSLLTAANSTTGISDSDLTAAVQRLINGYGGGSLPSNVYAGTITAPATQYNTARINCDFAPKIAAAKLIATVDGVQYKTYTVVYGINTGNQTGVYFQTGGFSRTYTANGTTGAARGHIIGTDATGFTIQTCEPYFASEQMILVAIGE